MKVNLLNIHKNKIFYFSNIIIYLPHFLITNGKHSSNFLYVQVFERLISIFSKKILLEGNLSSISRFLSTFYWLGSIKVWFANKTFMNCAINFTNEVNAWNEIINRYKGYTTGSFLNPSSKFLTITFSKNSENII